MEGDTMSAKGQNLALEPTTSWSLSKNQRDDTESTFSPDGEAMIYKALRHFWHPVLFTHELGDDPRRIILCGQVLVAVRLNGEVRVFNDLCAHRGTALSLGSVVSCADGQQLRCPYHGWEYDSDGHCVEVPQRPGFATQLRARVRAFHACERYGLVWVCLADEPRFPIPSFPEWDDDDYRKVVVPSDEWSCSAPRRTENYTDLGHFAIVHDGLLGDIAHPEPPEHEVWKDATALRMRTVHAKLEPWQTKYDEEPPEAVDGLVRHSQEWWLYMPLTVTFHQAGPGDRHYVLFFHPTPIGPHTTRNFTIAATRNLGGLQREPEAIRRFAFEGWVN